MNIYHPYDVLADTDDCLHIKESGVRERAQFLSAKVLPILLILLVWFVLQQVGTSIPMGWIYAMVFAALILAGLLFFRSYVTELKIIPGSEIFFVQQSPFGTKEKRIPAASVAALKLVRKKGFSKGVFFIINVKPGKDHTLLSIPASYIDAHHIRLISERLPQLLRVPLSAA